ncbi:hypothetical protein J6590_014029 [Homalodisca vitripennis]|nr:hypothetical protein J6590_014029 [Homalodisca vitripennis]
MQHYDDWGNCARRGASNKRFIHRRNKRNVRTYSSSDEETEVSFKNNQPGPSYKRKRAEGEDRPSKRQARRRFQDFPQEDPEPDMIDQKVRDTTREVLFAIHWGSPRLINLLLKNQPLQQFGSPRLVQQYYSGSKLVLIRMLHIETYVLEAYFSFFI